MFAIETRDLDRQFGATHAVRGLALKVKPGELFGLVGPDGAGKTTVLRLLAGLLEISSGHIVILGSDIGEDPEAIKPRIGYMAQQFSLYGELSVIENLRFFATLFDVRGSTLEARTKRLLEFAGLLEFKARRAAHLSGGMQKKLALACSLIHEPEILLLDEPTTGVDPVSRREFWNILAALHQQGTTILVSTPYMDEADRCSRVGLMYSGQMVVAGTPAHIRGLLTGEVVSLRTRDWHAAVRFLQDRADVLEVQTYGEAIHVIVESAKNQLPKLTQGLEQAGIEILEARQVPVRMEEAFISLIRGLQIEEQA